MNNPWSKNGVALYPPKYPVVGQSHVFNTLVNFRQQFSETDDLSGFFVLVGDWGLGKTRIGYELIAEAVGQIDEWLLDPEREYVAPNTNQRILEPQFADQILPLFIDYRSVTDHLGADIWTPKVACNALSLLWERPADLRVSTDLLNDLVSALKARGVNLSELQQAVQNGTDWKTRLKNSMNVLRPHGIRYLWVIVDEVETPGDLKRNPDYIPGREVEEEDLAMISQVIKESRYREDFPYVNFLLLCSLGMSDAIRIGPNLRRANIEILEPNRIYDVKTFQTHLYKSGVAVDYPDGTLEGAFIATNRNFGWFNKVMSSVHAIWEDAQQKGKPITASWKLLQYFAKGAASNKEIFDLSILDTISGINLRSITPESNLANQMIFSQLPVPIDSQNVSPESANLLLKTNIPGVGEAFAKLHQIHIDANTLANELLKPEFGFKKADRPDDDYFNPYTEFSLLGVLSALRAFSISIGDGDDFVIYENKDQFAEQLATLYPHEHDQTGKTIEQAAEPLHNIFMNFVVKNREYIGVSFKLLKKINIKMSAATRTVSFFRDRTFDANIESYVKNKSSSIKTRMNLICQGMAKVLDDTVLTWLSNSMNEDCAYVSFESEFNAPQMPSLNTTLKGKVTLAYCGNPEKTAKELSEMLGKVSETAQPILVLFGPSSDMDGFQREIERMALLKKCVILRKITSFEEEFLLKYSGKGTEFFPDQKPLSDNTFATRENLRQDLRSQFNTWRQTLDQNGFILGPIWSKSINIPKEDFFQGYRYLIAKNGTNDDLDPNTCNLPGWNALKWDNFKSAAKKNVTPGQGSTVELLPILSEDEPYRPTIPNALFQFLHELHSQASEDALKKRFFYANREKEAALPINQIIELFESLGLVYRPAGVNSAQFMAINKEQVENQLTVIKQWLQNQCPSLLREIQDIFPERAKELEKADLATANTYLKQAEDLIKQMQFAFIESGDLDSDKFKNLVKKVFDFEMLIQKICPLDPNQAFNLTTDQIRTYQDSYSHRSLWEKAHFLKWLRNQYIQKQNEIMSDLENQLNEAVGYRSIRDKPFPTTPITQPLRLIQNEIQMLIAGGTQSSMGWLTLTEFPLNISRHFLPGQYAEGWKRLEKLESLVSKTSTDSLWLRFTRQANAWKSVITDYEIAKQAWDQLDTFMNDALSGEKSKLNGLRKEFQSLLDLVDGGLEHDIQQQITSKPGIELLEMLEKEVNAADKYQGLAEKVGELFDQIHQELRLKIKAKRLEALNHALRSRAKPELTAPISGASYQKTTDAYAEFNALIEQQGKYLFEKQGKQTNWELWVQIYQLLEKENAELKPDHEVYVNELVQMGLLERRISLKR